MTALHIDELADVDPRAWLAEVIQKGRIRMVDERERDRRDAQRWRDHLVRTTGQDQPRLYRARLFEGSWEVRVGGPYPVVLDLTRGLALEESELKLNGLLRSLLELTKVKPDKVRLHYLDVRDWDTNEQVLQWPVTWQVEP